MRLRSPETLWQLSIKLREWKLTPLAKMVKVINYLWHRALLPIEAEIGNDLTLEHYALGIVIHPNVIIGDGVRIYHHVTIAGEMPLDSPERVIIGDRVTLGVNAVVIPRPYKGLTIGEDAVIGAGAVVTTDVPPGAVMVGVPARILKTNTQVESI